MLDTAVKFEKAFEIMEKDDSNFLFAFKEEEGGTPPTNNDWREVESLVKFLKIFYNATLRFSGSLYVTSNYFFNELVFIHSKLLALKRDDNSFISKMAESMLKKFEKYWDIKKINLLLFVAVVLDPRYKLKYVIFWFGRLHKIEVESGMPRRVKEALVRLYEWYDVNKANNVSPQKQNQVSASLVDEEGLEFLTSQFNKHMESEDNIGSKSEVERYLGESLEVDEKDKEFSVLTWWKNNGYKYPSLSCVARDVFAVPVSTVASELAFSTGGRVLDPFRNSLLPSTMEALICT
ncbi:hypothetical protein LguiB_006493 [Lonicera macranthoides]